MEIMPELYYEIKNELDLINDYLSKVINVESKVVYFSYDERLIQPSCVKEMCEKIRNLPSKVNLTAHDKVLLHNLSVILERFKHKFSNIKDEKYWHSYAAYERRYTTSSGS